jgi:hypothetical protein
MPFSINDLNLPARRISYWILVTLRVTLLSCIILGMLCTQPVLSQSGNLHFFSVIESDAINRPDRAVDQLRLTERVAGIAAVLGQDCYTYDFGKTHSFSTTAVRQTLNNLKRVSCESDVIWFHFSGYGRNNGDSTWPVLQLTDGEIELTEIITNLKQKLPKLLIITVDSGNKHGEEKTLSNQTGDDASEEETLRLQKLKRKAVSPVISLPELKEVPQFSLIENHERLFKRFDGLRTVILGSSSVGQNSAGSTTKGSLWLSQLCLILDQLKEEKTTISTWENAQKQITAKVQSTSKGAQNPQGSIKTTSIDCTY